MPECITCDGHVSKRFVEVFGDAHGQIAACPNCTSNAGIAETSRERLLAGRI